MKKLIFLTILSLMTAISVGGFAQDSPSSSYTEAAKSLTQDGALALAAQAKAAAQKLGKNVSVAVLNNSGVTILLLKGDGVGPHNTEASRRKAYTALSTKNASLDLMRKAAKSYDARNLNTLHELLLLGGGVPIWDGDQLIGSIGVSGGGGGQNDHNIAKAAVEKLGYKTEKVAVKGK